MVNRRKYANRMQDSRVRKGLLGDFALEDIHTYRVDRHSFTIDIDGDPSAHSSGENDEPGVEYNMTGRFSRNLNILSRIDRKRPILVDMSTSGGYVQEGWKIFDSIFRCPNPVTVLASKWARSMASIIPLAADLFLMAPTAQYMYHDGTFSVSGLSEQAETELIELLKSKEFMYRMYVARLKSQGVFKDLPEDKIREMLEERKRREIDVYLSAYEAEKWGFADGVCEGDVDAMRATEKNEERRELLRKVLRNQPTDVEVIEALLRSRKGTQVGSR